MVNFLKSFTVNQIISWFIGSLIGFLYTINVFADESKLLDRHKRPIKRGKKIINNINK